MASISQLRAQGVTLFTPRPPEPPEKSTSRAGRNLPAAIATAVILMGVVTVTLAFDTVWFALLAGVAFAIGLWEAAGAFLARDIHVPLLPMILGTVVMTGFTYAADIAAGLLAFCLMSLIVVVWRLFMKHPNALRDGVAGVFALAWISLNGLFAVELAGSNFGPLFVAVLILMPAASDTGGYVAGVLFGKHPIAARISPHKSWEGFAGSIVFSFLGALLLVYWLLEYGWGMVALFTFITPVMGTLGDFAESLLKRDLGVKDMGKIFPGHGGMLDRIDAMLFCAPVFYLCFELANAGM